MAKDIVYNIKLNGTDLAQKGAKGLNKELKETGKAASEAGNAGKGGFSALNAGAGKAAQGIQGLGGAIKGLGIIALVTVVLDLLKGFGALEPVVDRLSATFAALKAIFAELLDGGAALVRFVGEVFTEGFSKAFSNLKDSLNGLDFGEAIEGAYTLDRALKQLEEREIALIRTRSEQNKIIGQARLIADDVTESYAKRIQAVEEAFEAEKRVSEQELEIAREKLRILEAQNDLNTSSRADIRAANEQFQIVQQLELQSLQRQRRLNNELTSLKRERDSKNLETFKLEQDRLLKIANLQLEIQKELLVDLENFDNQRTLIDLEREQKLNEINTRIAKGEQVLQDEIKLINIQADKALAEIDKKELERKKLDEAKKLQLEIDAQNALLKIRELSLDSLNEIAVSESSTFEDRILANIRLLELTKERIELDREAALSAENLSKEQIDLINASADKALNDVTTKITEANKKLEKLGSGFLAQAFGLDNEEDIQKFREAIVASTELVQQGIASVFAFQSQLLQARLAELDEYSAEIDSRLSETQSNIDNLQAQFEESYGAQTNFVRAELRKQRAEERKLQTERENIDNQRKALQNEQAQRDKTIRSFETVVNTASAIVRAFAEFGFFPGSIFAAIIGGIGAAQLAAIQNTPVPQFASGGFTGGGLGFKDSTGHSVAGVVHSNEYVIPKKVLDTPLGAQLAGVAEAIRTNKKGFAEGGFTTPTVSSVLDTTSLNSRLDTLIRVTEQTNNRVVQLDLTELADRQSRLVQLKDSASI